MFAVRTDAPFAAVASKPPVVADFSVWLPLSTQPPRPLAFSL